MTAEPQFWLQFVVKHLIVVAVLMVGYLIVHRRSAAFKHSYLVIGFSWVALLPLLVFRAPHLSIQREVPNFMGVRDMATGRMSAPKQLLDRARLARMLEDSPADTATQSTPAVETGSVPEATPGWTPNRLVLIGATYSAGALFCLLRLLASLMAIAKIRRLSGPSSPEALAKLKSAAQAVGLKQAPDLLVNPNIAVPMTFWIGRSVVVVPSNDVSQAVLLHECAHIRRGDWFAQLFARLVCSLFWFDPILLFAERRMRAASEQAADDIVVSAGIEPIDYAQELFRIASHSAQHRFEAGLAIVGTSNLKARVGQILRIGPRVVRVPFRWAAITMLLGALTVIPFAAFHYSRTELPATDNGFIDFGNGYWIKLIAITEVRGGHAVSWNMKGELLPLPIEPSPSLVGDSRPLGPGRETLFFATNLDDPAGFRVDTEGVQDGRTTIEAARECWPFDPQTIDGSRLWGVGISLPKTQIAKLRLTTPTQAFTQTIATAQYKDGQLDTSSDRSLFPNNLKPRREQRVLVPRGFSGQVEMEIKDQKNETSSEARDAGLSDSFDFVTGPSSISKLALKNRPANQQFLLTNIPTRPLNDSVQPALPPTGIEFHDATSDRYSLRDGEVLSLLSISRPEGKRVHSWSPSGATVPSPIPDGDWNDTPDTLGYSYPESVTRAITFSISGPLDRKARFRNQGLTLFNAAGLQDDETRTVVAQRTHTDSVVYFRVASSAKPQDFVVRVPDPNRSSKFRMPIATFYTDRQVMPATGSSYAGKTLVDLVATRSSRLAAVKDDSTHEVSLHLLDAQGREIETEGFQTDYQTDHYMMDKPDLRRIASVEVVTMPYLFVRFPNVLVNPR